MTPLPPLTSPSPRGKPKFLLFQVLASRPAIANMYATMTRTGGGALLLLAALLPLLLAAAVEAQELEAADSLDSKGRRQKIMIFASFF